MGILVYAISMNHGFEYFLVNGFFVINIAAWTLHGYFDAGPNSSSGWADLNHPKIVCYST